MSSSGWRKAWWRQTADAVIVTDRNGVIEYVNPAVERMTGFAPKDLTDVRAALKRASKLSLARRVQQRMHPGPPPQGSGWDVAGAAIPADETSGGSGTRHGSRCRCGSRTT
ncbi:MAG TPA: PAS domain S-box protein [Vicinamibacterales bacterium]|nr:PAS domain S-box protein [Vicinamibacterales bacterium]HOQ61123.1 PAS domain S-box protein [Vicinamibacterales bacterium]